MNLYKKTEFMLYNYKNIKVEIKNILIEIEEVETSFRGVGAIVYDDMPKASNINSSVESEIEQKEKRVEYLNNLIIKKENEIKRIDNVLEVLTEREKKLIELRYFENLTHTKIAETLSVDVSTIYRCKKEIIDKLIPLIFIK